MEKQTSGGERPILTIVAALVAIALALPLAISSGQMTVGGIFDECYEEPCGAETRWAEVETGSKDR
ncbi:MAG: hypothetical protein AAGA09_08150 [Pseudomonadota bacterium]